LSKCKDIGFVSLNADRQFSLLPRICRSGKHEKSFSDLGTGSVERNMLVDLLPLVSPLDDWHSHSIFKSSVCGLIMEQVLGMRLISGLVFNFTRLQAYHNQCVAFATLEERRSSRTVMSRSFKII
jgi:hypothetical protein